MALVEMENSSNLTKCFICSENIKEARILPCFHSFCCDCLKKWFEYDVSNCKINNMPNCPECELPFELPKGGIEELKKNEFIDSIIGSENASLSRRTTCEICLEKTASKYCVNCKQKICESCIQVHEKFQSLKDHVLVDIRVNGIDTVDVKYCKSCNILLDDDCSTSHISCSVVDLSEFKEKFHKCLLRNLEQNYQNLSSVRQYLKYFDYKNLSKANDAELLKEHIQCHGENLKSDMERYINECIDNLNECIDEECSMIENKLILSRKQLLELETKIQNQIEKNQSNLQDLNQEILIDAIKSKCMEKIEQCAISTDEMKKEIASNYFERSMPYFEPAVLDQIYNVEKNIVGILRQESKSRVNPIKVIKDIVSMQRCAIYDEKLYGFSSKLIKIHHSTNYGKTFADTENYSRIPHISVFSLKTYELLYSIDFDTKYLIETFILVNRFLCFAASSTSLTIFDLKANKNSSTWKREVTLLFNIENLFPSSNENIFVLSSQKIFEITLYGNILKEIQLPSDSQLREAKLTQHSQGIGSKLSNTVVQSGKMQYYSDSSDLSSRLSGFVYLENDCYGVIFSGQLYVINGHGIVTRKLSSQFLQKSRRISDFAQIVTDKTSNIFVTSSNGREIFVFDYNLNYVKQLEAQCMPICLSYDSRRNRLLVIGDKELNVFPL